MHSTLTAHDAISWKPMCWGGSACFRGATHARPNFRSGAIHITITKSSESRSPRVDHRLPPSTLLQLAIREELSFEEVERIKISATVAQCLLFGTPATVGHEI
jgi:hypothetical protein